MKKVVLLTAVLLSATTMAYANCGMCQLAKGKKSEDWQKKKVEKMTKNLSLTEEQVSQVEALVEEKIEKKKAIREESLKKIENIREEYNSKVKALLDDDQKVKYDECEKERKEMKGMKGEGSGRMHKGMYEGMDKEDKASEDKS